MRISTLSMYNMATRSIRKNMSRLYDYSDQLSSGKRIGKPSDDPVGMTKVIDYKLRIKENEQYMRNMNDASSYLEYTETTMSAVTDILTRTREMAVEASNGSQSAQTRAMIAEEAINLRDELHRLSNSQFRDRYIFGGYKTDTPPFDSSYNYQGNSGQINVQIERNSTIASNIPGNTAFQFGGVSYQETLDDIVTALQSNDGAALSASITDIDNMLDQVARVRADLGAKISFIEKQRSALEEKNFTLEVFRTEVEDADITETVSEIAKTEIALEALRSSVSKMLSRSLIDFLG